MSLIELGSDETRHPNSGRYFIYASMTLLIPDPHGGNPIAWQSESLPGPGVYSYEVTGPELYLHLHGWTGANVTECKLFVYAQSD